MGNQIKKEKKKGVKRQVRILESSMIKKNDLKDKRNMLKKDLKIAREAGAPATDQREIKKDLQKNHQETCKNDGES